jgi:hypothetical protein
VPFPGQPIEVLGQERFELRAPEPLCLAIEKRVASGEPVLDRSQRGDPVVVEGAEAGGDQNLRGSPPVEELLPMEIPEDSLQEKRMSAPTSRVSRRASSTSSSKGRTRRMRWKKNVRGQRPSCSRLEAEYGRSHRTRSASPPS